MAIPSDKSAPETDVLLINMPFSNLYTPALGLSLLKASLAPSGAAESTLLP